MSLTVLLISLNHSHDCRIITITSRIIFVPVSRWTQQSAFATVKCASKSDTMTDFSVVGGVSLQVCTMLLSAPPGHPDGSRRNLLEQGRFSYAFLCALLRTVGFQTTVLVAV